MTLPPLDADAVTALATKALETLPGSVVYADRAPRSPGRVAVGNDTVTTEHPSVLVFRDEMPGANWMHPATYALVDLLTERILARSASDRPPAFGTLPGTWVVVSDPEGRADLVRPR